MANNTANINLQVNLNNAAAPGLAALTLQLIGLHSHSYALARIWNSLSPAMQGLAVGAGAAAGMFALFYNTVQDVVDAGMQLQDALTQVDIAVKGASEDTTGMQDALVSMANSSIYTAQQVADGFAQMGENSQTAADIINYSGEQMIILGEAIKSDTVPAANLLSTTMQMYGADASQAAEYTKALTFAFYNGQPSVTGLQQALAQAGPTAVQLHIPIQDLTIALDFLGEAGLKGTRAGSALRYMLSTLIDPTTKAQKALASLGLIAVNSTATAFETLRSKLEASGGSAKTAADHFDGTVKSLQDMFTAAQKAGLIHTDQDFYAWALAAGVLNNKLYDAQGNFIGMKDTLDKLAASLKNLNPQQQAEVLGQMFNVRGSQAVKEFVNNLAAVDPTWEKLAAALNKTQPADLAKQRMDNLSSAVTELKTSITDAMGVVGLQMVGPLHTLADLVNHVTGAFSVMPAPVHQVVAVFLIAGTVFFGLFAAVSVLVVIFTAFGSVLLPVMGIIGAVVGVGVALAGVITLIVSHGLQLKIAFAPIGNVITQISTIWSKFFDQLVGGHGVLTQMTNAFSGMNSKAGPAVGQIGAALKQLGAAFGDLAGAIKSILTSGVVLFILQAIVFVVGHQIGAILAGLGIVFGGVLNVFTGAVKIIAGIFMLIAALFTLNGKQLSKAWDNIWHGILQILSGLGQAVLGVLVGLVGGIVGMFKHLFDTLIGHSIIPDLVKGIIKFILQLQVQFLMLIISLVTGVLSHFAALPGAVLGILGTLATKAITGATKVATGITDEIKKLPGQLLALGPDIINGLLNGLSSLASSLANLFANAAKNALAAIKGVFGMHSPSKAMHEIGQNLTAGLLNGITEKDIAGAAATHYAGMLNTIPSALTPTAQRLAGAGALAGGGRGQQIVIPLYLDGKQIAEAALDTVTGQLQLQGFSRINR